MVSRHVAGGVSLFAAQLALAAGLRVIATTSSDAKAARLRELGVQDVINYRTTPEWQNEVLRVTDGVGADHVVDVTSRVMPSGVSNTKPLVSARAFKPEVASKLAVVAHAGRDVHTDRARLARRIDAPHVVAGALSVPPRALLPLLAPAPLLPLLAPERPLLPLLELDVVSSSSSEPADVGSESMLPHPRIALASRHRRAIRRVCHRMRGRSYYDLTHPRNRANALLRTYLGLRGLSLLRRPRSAKNSRIAIHDR